MFGFSRPEPSAAGPRLENPAMSSFGFVAPTVNEDA
jgi:hypothetical protein